MVKNWADHCASSDEEDLDLDEPIEVPNPDVLKKEIESENRAFQDTHDDDDEEEDAAPDAAAAAVPAGGKRTHEFPTEAPFTAYVGNLAYSIVDPQELSEKLTALVKDVLGADIKITDTRIMMDRRNPSPKPRHRGFAYVQVETLDMLKTLMELNEKSAQLLGRQLTLDTSTTNNNRRSSRNDGNSSNLPDGAQFRGGRFGSNNRRGSHNQQPPQRRQSDKKDDGAAPAQRPSLKLAPRTKPLEEGGSGSQSNIFGGGKARDEQAWQERRKSTTRNEEGGGAGGSGGRGGRGSGGRGRGGRTSNNGSAGGRGQRSSYKDNKERNHKPKPAAAPPAEEAAAPPVPASPTKAAEKPAEKKIVNKFAALDFSDSD